MHLGGGGCNHDHGSGHKHEHGEEHAHDHAHEEMEERKSDPHTVHDEENTVAQSD